MNSHTGIPKKGCAEAPRNGRQEALRHPRPGLKTHDPNQCGRRQRQEDPRTRSERRKRKKRRKRRKRRRREKKVLDAEGHTLCERPGVVQSCVIPPTR